MLAGTHIFDMSVGVPPRLLEKLLTAVELVLTEDGATDIWVDPHVSGCISVRAQLPSDVGSGGLTPPA
jgi:hypothetical protein